MGEKGSLSVNVVVDITVFLRKYKLFSSPLTGEGRVGVRVRIATPPAAFRNDKLGVERHFHTSWHPWQTGISHYLRRELLWGSGCRRSATHTLWCRRRLT